MQGFVTDLRDQGYGNLLTARTCGGETPIMMAIQSRKPEMISCCISMGLYVQDDTDYAGRTYQEQAKFYCAGQTGDSMIGLFNEASGPMLDDEQKATIAENVQSESFSAAAETVNGMREDAQMQ